MRIRRNIIAPLILTIGAVGSLVASPGSDRTDRRGPGHCCGRVGGATPDMIVYHGVK